MGLPSPVLAGLEGGGGKHAGNAQRILFGRHILHHGFQLIKAVDFLHGGCLCPLHGKIFLHDCVVIDDSVSLHHIGNAVNSLAVCDSQALVGEVLV